MSPQGQYELFGNAAEFLSGRERQQVETSRRGGPHCAGERGRLQRHVGIDEAQPFGFARHTSDAGPAGVRFAEPAGRQRWTFD